MQVAVENISPVKKLISVELPEAVVAVEFDNAYNALKKKAKVKGFRPGKVPRKVLENMFKKDVCNDVKTKLIQDTLFAAVTKAELLVIGQPIINPPELDEKGPFKYEVIFEVKPKIPDVNLKGFTIKKRKYNPTEEEVDNQLKKHQQDLIEAEPLTDDRPAEKGDVLSIVYEVFKNGKPFTDFPKSDDMKIKIGEEMIAKEIDSQLIGTKPGDNKEIFVSFPETHINPAIAGEGFDFHITVNGIFKEILPDIDDAFAKKVGNVDTVDELKTKIFNNLLEGYAKRTVHEMNEQIFEALLAQVEFEVPDIMVEYEVEGMLAEAGMKFSQSGLPEEQIQKMKETFAARFRETAAKQTERHLILEKVIAQEKINLSKEDLDNGFQEIAETNMIKLEQVQKFYDENKEQLELFKNTLLEKKAITHILDQSIIEDAPVENQENTEEMGQEKKDIL